MKAPAKESTANSPLKVKIVLQLDLFMPTQVISFLSLAYLGSSSFLSIKAQPMNLRPPSKAQNLTRFLADSFYVQPQFYTITLIQYPANTAPTACDRYPAILQYPKTFEVLSAIYYQSSTHFQTNSEREDCQIGMKGPIYPPEMDITPKMPLIVKIITFEAYAQKIPVKSLSSAPSIKVFILPILSALVVKKSETKISPNTMDDCIKLAWVGLIPLEKRF